MRSPRSSCRDARAAILPALVLALALVQPAPAAACSCVEPRLGRTLVPDEGVVDFPVDGIVRVFLRAFPETARAALASEYRLRDAAGNLVPLEARVVGTRLDLDPRAPLQPGSEYVLEQLFAFALSGARLSDTERFHSPAASLRGAFFPVVSFRTAAASASSAPAISPSISSARLYFAYGGGDCGPATRALVELAVPAPPAPTDVLELRVRGQGVVATEPATGTSSLSAGNTLCDPDPVTLRAGPIEVQVALLDVRGVERGASAWTRATGRGRRPRSGTGRQLSGAWTSIPIVPAPPAAAATGPSGCPHGLELVSRRVLVGENAPWMFGERSTIATERGSATSWIAFPGTEIAPAIRVFSLDASGAATALARVTAPGSPEALASGSRGPLIVARVYAADGSTQSSLLALDAAGTVAWTAPLPEPAGRFRIARGGGNVLVVWGARTAGYSEHLEYAVLDERTGHTIVPPTPTRFDLDTNAEGPSAAFVDGRFLVVWPSNGRFSSGPLMAAPLDLAHGLATPIALPIDSYSPPDLIAAGARAALATGSSDGRIEWSLLDRDGRIVAGPVTVSGGVGGGDNRVPRIAWDGSLFALAWETHPDSAAYVAVVDGAGASSPALRLDAAGDPHSGTVGVAATARGFLASYTADRARGVIAPLRCRARAPSGPPQTIAPAAP